MKTILFAALLAAAPAASAIAQDTAEDPTLVTAAERNLAQRFIALSLANQTPEIMAGLPADPVIEQLRIPYPDMTDAQEAEVRRIFGTAVARVNRQVMIESGLALSQAMTLAELEALVALYETEVGRSTMLKLGDFMGEIQPRMRERMQGDVMGINGAIIGVFEAE
ncbi:MAG: DUF2059 domain-containing protein [Pseudomonadota bacterium]